MKAQVFLGFSFGCRGNRPGLSNEAIAKAIAKRADWHTTFVCVQWEIGTALREIGFFPDQEINFLSGEKHLTTIDVAIHMKALINACHLHDFEVNVFAHQLHMRRCLRALKLLGIDANPIWIKVPFDRESSQWWTRSVSQWYIREIYGYCSIRKEEREKILSRPV